MTGTEPPLEVENERTPIGGKVRNSIFAALGRLPGLYDVAVRKLWDNHYRVNVLVGPDSTTAHIAHSYFVKAGENGDILSGKPLITRLYA
jgi:hypothetical protein